MNKRSPIRFAVPLLFFALSSPSAGRAQELGASELRAQLKPCLQAQSPLQCSTVLPACGAVLKTLDGLPSEQPFDATRDRLLHAYARCEDQVGQYAQAELHFRSLHALRLRLHGPEHPDVAASLSNLAGVLENQGKYAQAEPLFRQALAMRQKLLGAEHPDVASSLSKLAEVLSSQDKYTQAEPLFKQALAMRQKLLGAEHPDVASSLDNLARGLDSQGKYAQAELLFKQALAMRQKLLGTEHPDIATSLDNLAGVLYGQGKYAQAELLFKQALAMRRKLLGPEHPHAVTSLSNLAVVLDSQGKYAQAEPLSKQALAVRQKLLGAEHPDVATSLDILAKVLDSQGKYAQAEPLHKQALVMYKKLLGAEHPTVATSLNNLASVLDSQGKYAQAEPLYQQALAMHQKLLGAEHPTVAASLNNLAGVLEGQGKYAQAEPLYKQALAMCQKLLGAEHPTVARGLNNLAGVLSSQGRYAQAEPLYKQALVMLQKLLGAEHPDVASSLNNLARVLESQGEYIQAEALSKQALAMSQKLLGAEHPTIATSLNNLARARSSQGKHAQAEPLFQQALKMRQKLLGAEHPTVALSLNNLAAVLLARAAPDEARPLLRQAAVIREAQLRVTVSETRMQALLDGLRGEEDAIYGLLLSAPNVDTSALALQVALLRKGRVAEAGAAANRRLHRNLKDPELSRKFADWQALRSQQEALLYAGPGTLSAADYRTRVKELKLQAEGLEYQLAAELPELQALQPPSFDEIVPAVARRLPADGVLVEIVWVEPYQYSAGQDGEHRGAPHYVALLLFPDGRIVQQDMGKAALMDERVRALHGALGSPASDPVPVARAAYDALLRPLFPHLHGHTHLYLSLDGTLHMVPFDALHDGTNYMLGRYRFHYLTSGRDLLREPTGQATETSLILADPAFGKAEPRAAENEPRTLYQRLESLEALPGTAREARALGHLLRVVPRLGTEATEALLRAARAPAVLHIATHGLFLDDAELPVPVDGRGLGSLLSQRSKLAPVSPELVIPAAETLLLTGGAGPLHRSALVLAGAARRAQAHSSAEDGLLTADEARSLDLYGTQLVVLSACETGRGALSAGQGVYGLRRAFLVAGAETLVTSLWRVHDEATGELMTLYYKKLLDGTQLRDRLGGMVEAMQELRQRPGRSHPYYWAPFLVIGQDGPLRLTR